MSYNGGACVAMVGKNCVAIASDKRFGMQAMTISTDFGKLFNVNDKLYYGLAGLVSDVQTLYAFSYLDTQRFPPGRLISPSFSEIRPPDIMSNGFHVVGLCFSCCSYTSPD